MNFQKVLSLLFSMFLFSQFLHAQKNVGINNTSPRTELDVIGTTTITRSSSSNSPQLDLKDLGDGYARLKFSRDLGISDNYWLLASRAYEGDDALSRFNLYYKGDNLTGNLMTVNGEGMVGFGATPTDHLHLNVPANRDAFRIQIGGSTKFRIFSNGGVSMGLNNINVPTNGLYVHGNTGLGVSNASEKLEVAGNVSVTGNINFNGTLLQNNIPFTSVSSIGELIDAKTGGNSIFLGTSSGINDDGSGNSNTGVGDFSLNKNISGYENVAIGQAASYNNKGNNNVAIGYQADYNNTAGWNNTMIGHKAGGGTSSHTKHGNVFIGALAGFNETGSDKLYIHNNNTSAPLIWGDFTSTLEKIKINGDFEVKSNKKATLHNLQIPTNATDGYVLTSDATGNATWQAGGGAADTDWTILSGGEIFRAGKVLIGAASASSDATLSIGGNSTTSSQIFARNSLTSAYGIHGSTWASGFSVGVYGNTMGSASSSTDAIGVYGSSTSGVGVRGHTSNTTGIAILGTRSGTVGLAGRFEGPVEVTGKLSVGANPTIQAYQLAVDGSAAKSSGGSSWAVVSDKRLKDIQGNYERGLTEIKKLNTVVFNYKKDNPFQLPSDSKEYGFIAQEVQEIYPEAITSIDGEYLDFNFHPILVSMVNAVQELSAENEVLKETISALKDSNKQDRLEKNVMLSELNTQKLKYSELESRLEKLEEVLNQ